MAGWPSCDSFQQRSTETLFVSMAKTKKPAQRYYVDARMAIGLDALNDSQKTEVGGVIMDRDHFLAHVADRRKVETISKRMSLYALSVPSGLNVIYKNSGGDVEVLDLMGNGTLHKYGAKKKSRSQEHSQVDGESEGLGLAPSFLHEAV
jgi:hypothetical protein